MIVSTNITYIPMRSEASHRSEQCSQLLFGENAQVLEETKEWYKVKMLFDNYVGWVEKKAVSIIQETNTVKQPICQIRETITIGNSKYVVPCGGEISKNTSDIGIEENKQPDFLIELSKSFLGTPYLWGGRTFHGIDCSGFIQILFKTIHIAMPRDASEQVKYGKKIQSIEDTVKGDLAFFKNETGSITHVGLLIGNNEIIHASGYVRIDKIDDKGIFNSENQNYSHYLYTFSRIL